MVGLLSDVMKSSLRVVRAEAHTGGVEIPNDCVILGSTDFVRELVEESRGRGEEVLRDVDSNLYVFDGVPIEPIGELPLRTFVILARRRQSK